MIFDVQGLFSNKQAIDGTVGTTVSTNVIDTGATDVPIGAAAAWAYDLGKGPAIPLRVQMTTAAAGGTSLQVIVQTSVDEAFSSPIVVLSSAAIAVASLVAGYVFVLDQIPRGVTARYIRLAYTRVGTLTAGNVTAGVVASNDEWYK